MAYYTYDGCCGSCIYMNTNDYYRHKDNCYCTYRNHYYNLTEPKCSYYKYDKNKDYYDLNHRWHIVSSIFNKLNLKDEYECIKVLHDFRINFLEQKEEYSDFLSEYDIIAPVIARCLDNDDELLCKKLIQAFLGEILDYIKGNRIDLAYQRYIDMYNLLKDIYRDEINDYLDTKQSLKKTL